jgi:hypothetical protein
MSSRWVLLLMALLAIAFPGSDRGVEVIDSGSDQKAYRHGLLGSESIVGVDHIPRAPVMTPKVNNVAGRPLSQDEIEAVQSVAVDWSGWASQGGLKVNSDIAVGRNADGRLELFVAASDNELWHKWQLAPNGGWPDWVNQGGIAIISNIAVGQNADGRLEVFVAASNRELWHKWQIAPNGVWSPWANLGGVVLSADPTVGQNADGRLEVFVRASDNELWHRWQTDLGQWSPWASLGGVVLSSDPVVARNADGRLEVFVRASDNELWHRWQLAPA